MTHLKSWPSATHKEASARVGALRRALQCAVCLPIGGVEELWREYDLFERGESEQNRIGEDRLNHQTNPANPMKASEARPAVIIPMAAP